eukprot:gene2596-14113_t
MPCGLDPAPPPHTTTWEGGRGWGGPARVAAALKEHGTSGALFCNPPGRAAAAPSAVEVIDRDMPVVAAAVAAAGAASARLS